MRNFILFSVLFLVLSSCSSEKNWTFHSTDKQVEVKVLAHRSIVLDPYEVSVQVKAYGHERTFVTEVTNMGLEDEEVKMTWTDNQHCILSFTESDNQKQNYWIIADPQGIFIKME